MPAPTRPVEFCGRHVLMRPCPECANDNTEAPVERVLRGIKKDEGKPAIDLIDPHFIEGVAQVLTFGAKKYEPDNWQKGMYVGKAIAGVLRHVYARLRGEIHDPETQLPHMYHAACGLMFVAYYDRNGITKPDDRWGK